MSTKCGELRRASVKEEREKNQMQRLPPPKLMTSIGRMFWFSLRSLYSFSHFMMVWSSYVMYTSLIPTLSHPHLRSKDRLIFQHAVSLSTEAANTPQWAYSLSARIYARPVVTWKGCFPRNPHQHVHLVPCFLLPQYTIHHLKVLQHLKHGYLWSKGGNLWRL